MTNQPLPFTRDDTMLGLCHTLAEETGVPANALRIGLALALFWNPLVVMTGYVVAATLANLLRWFFPLPQAAASVAPEVSAPKGDNDDDATPLARAA